MNTPQAQPMVMVRLAGAPLEQVMHLAQAKQWMMHPDTFKAMTTPGTKEHLTAQQVGEWASAGTIDVMISKIVPVGLVIPQGGQSPLLVLDVVPNDEDYVPVVSNRLRAWVLGAIGLMVAIIAYVFLVVIPATR